MSQSRNSDLTFSIPSHSLAISGWLSQVIALGEDVVGQVVYWVSWAETVHLNHALSEHWDDLLHQELAHVQLRGVLKLFHVVLDRGKTAVLELLKAFALKLTLLLLVLAGLGNLLLGVSFLLDKLFFTFDVEHADRWEVVVRSTRALDINSHGLEHLKGVAITLDLEHLSLVLLEES